MLIVVAAAWAVILILIIIIIVVGVKLRRRNEELDEFYDEHESIGNSKGSRAVVEKNLVNSSKDIRTKRMIL